MKNLTTSVERSTEAMAGPPGRPSLQISMIGTRGVPARYGGFRDGRRGGRQAPGRHGPRRDGVLPPASGRRTAAGELSRDAPGAPARHAAGQVTGDTEPHGAVLSPAQN